MPKPMCQSRSYPLLTAAATATNPLHLRGRSIGHVAAPASLLALAKCR